MDSYLLLKLLHIGSAVVVAGTGTGIAFFMFMAYRVGNPAAFAVTTRHVVLADWLFTTPAIIVQAVTGVLLMLRLGYSFQSPWFLLVAGLFLFVGLCWVPVIFIQYKLRNLAVLALDKSELDPRCRKLMRLWTGLGAAALCAIVAIFWLMLFKPLPVL